MQAVIYFFKDTCCRRHKPYLIDDLPPLKGMIYNEPMLCEKHFKKWMTFQHTEPIDFSKKVLEWLSADLGYKYFQTYADFVKVTVVLQKTFPTMKMHSEETFWKAYDAARKEHLGEVEEVYLEPKRTLDIGGI